MSKNIAKPQIKLGFHFNGEIIVNDEIIVDNIDFKLNVKQRQPKTGAPGIKQSGPEVIKLFSCSTQLSMKFSPLIYVKMPTIVGILTCMSGKNNILCLTEPLKDRIS